MEKAGVSLPLLVLPAHQTEALLYEGGSLDDQMRGKPQPHLKVAMVSLLTLSLDCVFCLRRAVVVCMYVCMDVFDPTYVATCVLLVVCTLHLV